MVRKDGQRRAFDRSPASSLGFAHPGGPAPESDVGPADHVLGDVAEETSASWESAWIDLGGEG